MTANPNEYATYVRRSDQVRAKKFALGDEDGLLVSCFKNKQKIVDKADKHYQKYTDRVDYDEVAPFLYTPNGPLLLFPDTWIVIDISLQTPSVYTSEAFSRVFQDEGRVVLSH